MHCSHTQSVDVDESSDESLDLNLGWILQHGFLLEEFLHQAKVHQKNKKLFCLPMNEASMPIPHQRPTNKLTFYIPKTMRTFITYMSHDMRFPAMWHFDY